MHKKSSFLLLIAFSIGLHLLFVDPENVLAVDPALEAYRKSYKASRESELSRAFLEAGRKEVERGSYFRAVSLLNNAINKGAGPEAYELRAKAHQGMGANDLAISDLGLFINSRPNDPAPYMARADAYLGMGQAEKAMQDYDRALEIDPFSIDGYLSRGLANVSFEKYEAAISDFELALRIDPYNSEALFNAAITCFMAGMPKAGKSYSSRFLAQNSDARYSTLISERSSKAPETSVYEERLGGLRGILSETAKLASTRGATEQNQPSSTIQDSPFKGLPSIDAQNRAAKPKDLRDIIAMIGKDDFSGTWAGAYMGMNWSASFKFSGSTSVGTLKIITPSGKVETHYCRGVFENNRVEASDQLGFRVSGRISDDLRFVGNITTPDHKTVPVDVPLLQ